MPQLKTILPQAGRVAVTLAVVAVAVVGGKRLWDHYQVDPWTRDGRVRADIVQVAPDVSGLVTDVQVVNDQTVKAGQPLFYVDRDRYALAVRQADAAVAAQRAQLAQARRELARNRLLGDLVAGEVTEQSLAKVEQGQAALAQAQAARDLAALNLKRTLVTAPTDGFLSDLTLRTGDYVTAGKPVLALIDSRSFRVEGYFEETKLKGLHVGQKVDVRVMGEDRPLHGHIQSIAAGIEDRDRAAGASLLPNVNPTFSWVRLAQRVPVRVALDETPKDLRLIAGRTATVAVLGQGARATGAKQ
ncbi:efflux transporter periplasmic adaptor subunit [Caulobacter sp. D4A]|uniref:efflux RND transporter periplasmic adaptor subunit n=1 Tax=unclassified Caulobacter TaxID=2648921 RepID=UPI000D734672|nr:MULTISPECIES: efflux RND transporter periplasmic adaptor subunit [unclassified Caulobacter]PXA90418.1 efflux transporter periplasmic adaptor subunit [Caulobacter sp. D5]PXA91605.1 efflux transporter periplasmic adaptor subunit [Caulobacter sp. D4A]